MYRSVFPILGAILHYTILHPNFHDLSLFVFLLENWLSVVSFPCGAILPHKSNFLEN